MAYRVHETVAKSVVAFRAANPETGQPVLVTVHTGEAVVAIDAGAVVVTRRGVDNAAPVGFFVPNVAPLAEGDPVPVVLAEMYLCGVIVQGAAGFDTNYGVTDAVGTYAPDPRGGPARWLTLNFTCRAVRGLRVGYRVTVIS